MLAKHFAPKIGDAELLQREMLANAMLLTLRGVPTIYYGDEQGFVGKGGDQDARQDMFASQVATYNEDKLLGTSATTAQANFNSEHPLYREIAALARIRTGYRALTRGRQVVRYAQDKPGLFAVSRFDPASGREVLLLFNTSTSAIRQNVVVETRSSHFETLAGTCPITASAPGSVAAELAPLAYAVCNAR
jgi:glycosidase